MIKEFFKKRNSLLSVSVMIIMLYFSSSALGSYITLYYNQIGLTNSQIGIISSLGAVAVMICQPFWGRFADKAGRKKILYIALAGSGLSVLLYPVVSKFTLIVAVSLIYNIFTMAINPVSDSVTIDFCNHEKYNFGPVRLCGTIGYAVAPLILGGLFDRDLLLIFPVYFILCIVSIVTTILIPKWLDDTGVSAASDGKKSKSSLLRVLKDPLVVFILAVNFILSLGTGILQYYPVMASDLGFSVKAIGFLNSLSTFSEIPSLLLIGYVVKKIKSEKIMLSALFFSALRLGFMFAAPLLAGWALVCFIFAKLLQSVTYITNYYCSANLIHERFPDDMKASAQALLAVISSGIGRILSSLVGGFLADSIGLGNAFGFMALFVLAGGIAMTVFYWSISRKEKEQQKA